MMSRAVLFDLDGTLVDIPVDIEAVRAELAAMFAPLGYGLPFRPILERIADASAQVSQSESERLAVRGRAMSILDEAERVAAGSAVAVSGAAAVVTALIDAGVPVGIVTNNSRGCITPALARIGHADTGWTSLISRDDAAAKPNPSGVAEAARALLPGGGRLWFVGDGDRDIQAAQNADQLLANVDVVSVGLLRDGNEDRLRAAKPAELIDDLALLGRLVGLS